MELRAGSKKQHREAQDAKRTASYKSQGLDEHGRGKLKEEPVGEVDINKIEREAAKKKAEAMEITSKLIDGSHYFKGKPLDKWFDDYGECVSQNAHARRVTENKKLGLNEFGQTPEMEARQAKVAEIQQAIRDHQAAISDLVAERSQVKNLTAKDLGLETKKKKKK